MESLDPIPLEPESPAPRPVPVPDPAPVARPAPVAAPAPVGRLAPVLREAPVDCDATIVTPAAAPLAAASAAKSAEATITPSASADAAPAPPPQRAGRAGVDPIIGREIGGVTITALIGEGGMGRVYAGTRGESKERVAVKLLSRGFDNPESVARFQREAQILDGLHHPGIAELRSHGVWDDGSGGIPYMVMELIDEARTIESFAVERKLDLRGRLELFLRACEAVAFAHQMKVLHRDLKPANLLVDRFGRVKVIDFGVARAANGDLGIAGVRTQTGQLIGTVQYMSPEQIAGDPRAIDLRTDVYALGVILYEMLLDAYPYDVRGLPLHEAARIVSEAQIEPPRQRDPSIDEALEQLAMKCLARNRDQRFESAVAVAAALERYLFPPPGATQPRRAVAAAASGSKRGAEHAPDDTIATARPPADRRRAEHARPRARGAGGNSSRTGWSMMVGAILLLAAGGAVATGLVDVRDLRRLIPGGSGPAGSPAATIAAPSTLNMENLTVLSAPEGAIVTIDGARMGRTPISTMISWSAGSTTKSVEVSAPGYETSTGLIMPDPAGRRGESLRMVFNLAPRAARNEPSLERVLPLRIEGGGVELRIEGGAIHSLHEGLREVKLDFQQRDGSFGSRTIVLRAAGRRIDAFERSALDELAVDLDADTIGDHARLVRISKP